MKDKELIILRPGQYDGFCKNITDGRIFNFRYVLPCEKFMSIRMLQMLMYRSPECKNNKIYIYLDEWPEHRDDEYFLIMLKYLHDHRDRYDFSFIAEVLTERTADELYKLMRCYLPLTMVRDGIWADKEQTERHFTEMFGYDEEAARFLTKIFSTGDFSAKREDGFVALLTDETRTLCGSEKIGIKELRHCFEDKDYLLRILLDYIPDEMKNSENERGI